MRICDIKDCDNKHLAKGLCSKHYLRVYKRGTINISSPRDITTFDRIMRNTVKLDNECLELTRYINKKGYGHLRDAGKMRLAHVIVYEHENGKMPKNKEIDHLCRNKACVNLKHLEVVTHKENVRRGNAGKNYVDLKRDLDGKFIGKKTRS